MFTFWSMFELVRESAKIKTKSSIKTEISNQTRPEKQEKIIHLQYQLNK